MATQIKTINAKNIEITVKTGVRKFQAPKSWTDFMDVLCFLSSDEDCKTVCDAYRSKLSDEQYCKLRKGFFPTLSDKKAQAKRTASANKRMSKEAKAVEALQSVYAAQPGFLGKPSITKADIKENIPADIQKAYGY